MKDQESGGGKVENPREASFNRGRSTELQKAVGSGKGNGLVVWWFLREIQVAGDWFPSSREGVVGGGGDILSRVFQEPHPTKARNSM